MGAICPPLYGENQAFYAKEAVKAVETAKTAIKEGNKDKALSAIEYAEKCTKDLVSILNKEAE